MPCTNCPPKLLRKGRFDEIFFVDLPSAAVRGETSALYLSRRKLDPEQFDLAALAAASDGFSGAEIEQTIVSSLYDAAGSGTPADQPTLIRALAQTRSLSVLMREQVEALREWRRSVAWRLIELHRANRQGDTSSRVCGRVRF